MRPNSLSHCKDETAIIHELCRQAYSDHPERTGYRVQSQGRVRVERA